MAAERQLRPIDYSEPAVLDFATLKSVMIDGDLTKLDDEQLIEYNRAVCQAIGIDYRTQPFAYLKLNGKLVLYARKDCTEQLRRNHHVSIPRLEREVIGDVYTVTATARLPDGREDTSTGAVFIGSLRGEALANAYMKAETKAKRRVTLSICGLGMLDESETDSIAGAEYVDVVQRNAPETHEAAPSEANRLLSAPDVRGLYEYAKRQSVRAADVNEHIHEAFGCEAHELTLGQGRDVLAWIKEQGELARAELNPSDDELNAGRP